MQQFFKWTAWTMEKPQSYGTFHLTFMCVGLFLCVVLAWLLRKTNDKQNKIILFVVGGFLLISEIYKQLFWFYVIEDKVYTWWILPFQFCGMPMYLSLIAAFCQNEKVNSWIYNFMFAFNLFSGGIAFLEPSGFHHTYITLTLHSYIWHLIIVFLGFYLYFSKRACTNAKDYYKAIVVFLILATIAQILNVTIQNRINMFFISPYEVSSIVVFHDIFLKWGWFANMVLFLLGIILSSAIIYYIGYGFRILKKKATDKII